MRTSTGCATCEGLPASSSRWRRNSSERFPLTVTSKARCWATLRRAGHNPRGWLGKAAGRSGLGRLLFALKPEPRARADHEREKNDDRPECCAAPCFLRRCHVLLRSPLLLRLPLLLRAAEPWDAVQLAQFGRRCDALSYSASNRTPAAYI